MAVDKLVDSTQLNTNLTSVANAIRAKSGGSNQLAFPSGFVSEISNIPSGGGGIDVSDAAVPIAQNTIGGLFTAMQNGTWDVLEFTNTSGANPIEIDFGRAIKGYIAYPKSITCLSGLPKDENNAFAIAIFDDPDGNGAQAPLYAVNQYKTNGGTQTKLFNRISSYTFVNGLLSLVPNYPSNASYNPFGFNNTYIFVYWWGTSA